MVLELEKTGGRRDSKARRQLNVLIRRSELLRTSVFFMGSSVFLSALIILGLFLRLFAGWSLQGPILSVLFLSVGSLCVSMVFFLLDVSLALKAVKVEVEEQDR